MTALDTVGELFAHALAELYGDVADVPLLEGFLGQVVGQLETELCLSGHLEGVGEVGGKIVVVIVVAVVTEKGGDAVPLPVESRDVEGILRLDERLAAGGIDEGLKGVGEVDVGHAVEGEEGVESDGIADLALLRVLLWHLLVGNLAAEVAIALENGLCDGSAQGRVHLTHQHGGTAEGLLHPTGELGVFVGVFVVDPQPPRPGGVVVTAAEEGSVGSHGQGGFDFFLGLVEVILEGIFIWFVEVGDRRQTREELVVLGDVLGHGTRGEEE